MEKGTLKKLLFIVESPFRKKAAVLQVYLLIGVLFESVGLGLIIPLVQVIMDPKGSEQSIVIRIIRKITGDIGTQQLVLAVLVAFVLFYVIKTVFLSFLVLKQSEFTQGLSRNVSSRLYKGYLFQPYAFFLDKNSGVLMKNITTEISAFTAFVQAVMYMQVELSVLAGIVVTLFYLQPVGALIIFAFVGGVSYLLFSFSKRRISVWGKERQLYDGLRSKNLSQGLTGIAELKLFHKENFFLGKYDAFNKSFYSSQRRVQFIQQVQRFYLELVLIVSIVLIALVVILQGKSVSTILPSLSVFLFAALRLLPSSNRVISNLQQMRYHKPAIDLVYNEFKTFEKENREVPSGLPTVKKIHSEIRLQNISFDYPGATKKALDDINLTIPVGSVTGIIGQSGSGKTTLVNVLTGLLQSSSGKIMLDDTDITHKTYELQKFIGYVPQHIFLVDDTLKNNIAFGIPEEQKDEQRLRFVIDAAQLNEVVENASEGLDTIVGERGIKLSGGQRQRIGIARALYNDPSVLILDEGTSALDTETENYIMESVAHLKGKLTIILVAHRYSTLHFADVVYKMQNGAIVAKGKLEELA
ncbi:ABC transporter ATP-binding protein [Sediminibacterium roseum]|uniref:ABC transporter ATP-binding protein n=1 Tax=Sediminibacterium roseum TaxID=1978412 RepID=A0ABW9ZPJ4_9BACT|nr:ABC transporter ATP-binding protein [Sediminibacterium roseum]NCI49019.1 ABC transporter ATP-binding protein [Sediminibacterium roseum]